MKNILIKFVLLFSAAVLLSCTSEEAPQQTSAPEPVAEALELESPEPAASESGPQANQAPAGIVHRPYDGDPTGLAEIKLIDAQDDPRGWCVDLFAHRTGARPIGGMQGHNCFMYFDIGSPTEDQGFDTVLFAETGQLEIPYFDVCLTLNEPSAGSYVAADPCTEDGSQTFAMTDEGLIQPNSAPNLCLTLGPTSVPGGGRLPPPGDGVRPPANNDRIHLIRRLTFEECSEGLADLQRWEFRFSEYIADESAEPHRFIY